ncbi:unnamed protein product [Closterium sp. NIES-64]|nr:unnamed protein product [Closterium sp. NIES-64]
MALTAADAGPIYNLLEAALNEATRKEAEQALNAFETREIISRKELDQKGGARWLAAIYFKNSINRYWRARRETQGISDEEKPVLRARLLELVADENSQVAVQLAVLIAKIARIDYPREWSELFPTLLQKLQSQDPLLTQRAYLVLNHVLKELSTKRLSVDQRTFSQVTSQLFEPTWAHWVRDTGSLLQGLTALEAGGSDPAAAAAGAGAAGGALMLLCERWLLCVKTLRRMLVFGFPSDFKSVQEVPVLEQVVPAFLEAAQSLLNFRNLSQQRPALQPLHTFLSRASVKLLKTLVASHELHPFSFASKNVLLPTLDFCYTQITTTNPTASSPSPSLSTPLAAATSPQTPATAAAAAAAATDASASSSASSHGLFLIECMLFLQSVLRCVAYKQNPTGHVVGAAVASAEEMRGKLSGMARQQLQGFFSQEKVVTLGGVLVQRYLVLTAGDLEEWGADPEVFYHEQGAVQWKDKLQLCQSSLFHLSLFLALPDSLLCLFSQLLGADSSGFRGVGGGPRADLEEWGADPEVFYDEQGTVHYLVLTAGDLEESGADPEVFYHEQGAVQWKDKLRPSSYPLHLSLSSSVSLPCLADSYLVLTAGDLEEWGLDPEVFYHEQGAVQWKDKLRPCAEALLLLLFEQFKEVLSPALMNMLRQCIEACPPPASPDADVPVTPALLLKDACYDAVGVACYDLHDVVDFKTWFTTALLPDMACRHPNARILRRRAAWMVGQWVGKVEGDLCVPAYQALISLLPDEDLVVQLTAVSSLRTLIDDVHFYEDQFAPFLDTAVQLLFRCLQQVSEFDSQLQIVNVVSLIIERMGEKIVPLADKILSCLPQVWEQSEGQPLLRIQVMQALQRLIVSLGPQSPISYPLLFPILRYSTDISQPDELNMLEDGLQLWQATLRHAPAMVPEFMTLFANLVPIMDRSFEHLPVATAIMESYVLVGGPAFLQQHAGSLVSMIDAVVGNVKEKAMLLVAGLVDLIIQCYPSEAPPALESVLQKLLLIIIGPTEYSDLVRGTCATVLARVVLQNSSYFAQFISADSTRHLLQQQSAAKGNAPPLALFLDAWLDKVDSVSVPAKRKLSTLALAVLLTMPEPQILERLDLILSVCTGSLGEDNPDNTPLLPDISTVGYDYASVSDSIQGGEGAPVECEALRRRQVASIDPVHRVAVGPFLKEKLQACVAVHGEQQFQAAMARVPPPIVSQLQQL